MLCAFPCALEVHACWEYWGCIRVLGGYKEPEPAPWALLAETMLTPGSGAQIAATASGWTGSSGCLRCSGMPQAGNVSEAFRWGRKEG